MNDFDNIVALSTPEGESALAVIRASGSSLFPIISKHLKNSDNFNKSKPNRIKIYKFINESNIIIDEITVIKYLNPKSFTGENMVEIICHGGKLVVKQIINNLLLSGLRYAERGEFTRRSFINGKKTLAQAESINQIIHSKTDIQKNSAINSYFGGYGEKINVWKKNIENILSDIESEIEFNESDDIIENTLYDRIITRIKDIKKDITEELIKRDSFKKIEKGIVISLVGPVNAGKSTIMNTLIGYNRSIVDSEEGTTRDFISENIEINNSDITLIDTAGLHFTDNRVEKKGIDKTNKLIENSNILIWVTPSDKDFTKEEKIFIDNKKYHIVSIINKSDIQKNYNKEKILSNNNISFINYNNKTDNSKKLKEFIKIEIDNFSKNLNFSTFIINNRQEELVKRVKQKLIEIEEGLVFGEEIIAIYCREILNITEEFTGKATTDDIINNIFNEFCIGK